MITHATISFTNVLHNHHIKTLYAALLAVLTFFFARYSHTNAHASGKISNHHGGKIKKPAITPTIDHLVHHFVDHHFLAPSIGKR